MRVHKVAKQEGEEVRVVVECAGIQLVLDLVQDPNSAASRRRVAWST